MFYALGGYLYASDIHSTVPGSGLTNGDNRAFYSTVRRNGLLPKTLNGQPMEYQFEFRPTDTAGNRPGPWTVISPAQFASTALGKLEGYAPAFPGDPNPIKTAWVYADPAVPGGGPVNAVIAGGWIRVPQASNVFGPEGFFVPNGNMLNVITGSLAASPAISVLGVDAGQSSTALGAPLANNRHIGLRMRVREVGDPASEVGAGTCFHVAIENTAYNGVAKGGSWAPSTVNGQCGSAHMNAGAAGPPAVPASPAGSTCCSPRAIPTSGRSRSAWRDGRAVRLHPAAGGPGRALRHRDQRLRHRQPCRLRLHHHAERQPAADHRRQHPEPDPRPDRLLQEVAGHA